MPIFGPYAIGEKIPDTALIGTDMSRSQLYAVVGQFADNISVIPPLTDRQDIDALGVVLDHQYCGPAAPARVITWGMIPKDWFLFCSCLPGGCNFLREGLGTKQNHTTSMRCTSTITGSRSLPYEGANSEQSKFILASARCFAFWHASFSAL